MPNVFDIVPSNFFNLLSSGSNQKVYSGCLLAIYEVYDQEITYRIPREKVRGALEQYLMDNHIEIDDPDFTGDSTPRNIASQILHKLSQPEVGWLKDEIDDTTYGHNIVLTEQGIALAEFLQRLMKPERAEFSGYIFDIYNRLKNRDQWKDNPYVNAVVAVYRNAKALSGSLKQLSTFIRDIIEKMVKEETLESLTENIIAYCSGDFVREYARLNSQQNIHLYRTSITSSLEKMQKNKATRELTIKTCMDETGKDREEAIELIDDRISQTKRFLTEDYDQIMSDIAKKINVYLRIAVGRARFIQNRDVSARGTVEKVLKYLIENSDEIGEKELLPEEFGELFSFDTDEYIDTDSLRYPSNVKQIRKSQEVATMVITEEEKKQALEKQKEAAFNPYSKSLMEQFVKNQMKDRGYVTSDELPMNTPDDLLRALSAVAYSDDNGFTVKKREGYFEKNNLLLHKFVIEEDKNR